ncbi:hypothetical protein Scep_017260 [Stephania cephalantha]|uniref:Uncharacterized protein n=1 Tax=Stephania cephalantha TaxID=152367 RepID=A0AAP0NTE3_9MAGN
MMTEHDRVKNIHVYLEKDETAPPLSFKMPQDNPNLVGPPKVRPRAIALPALFVEMKSPYKAWQEFIVFNRSLARVPDKILLINPIHKLLLINPIHGDGEVDKLRETSKLECALVSGANRRPFFSFSFSFSDAARQLTLLLLHRVARCSSTPSPPSLSLLIAALLPRSVNSLSSFSAAGRQQPLILLQPGVVGHGFLVGWGGYLRRGGWERSVERDTGRMKKEAISKSLFDRRRCMRAAETEERRCGGLTEQGAAAFNKSSGKRRYVEAFPWRGTWRKNSAQSSGGGGSPAAAMEGGGA